MIRTINVKGRTGRFDVPSFLWTENETLTLKFDVAEKRVGRYVATVLCGEQTKTVYLGREMAVDVAPEFVANGGYQPITVLLGFYPPKGTRAIISNDPSSGGFCIEPLKIERVDENTCAVAWMQKLERDFAELSARMDATETKLKRFEDNSVPLIMED